ncbi:protein rhomboid-like [Hyposmocoma kahamanoa]|uniref:protein rhomboid-like n=1 Tax=Hyposmocoma kahamanoa TaxID=1477025 RepID=UPI000E6D8F36|nr:protein rhomboid-like [Hyposmocoma kahamanoa]
MAQEASTERTRAHADYLPVPVPGAGAGAGRVHAPRPPPARAWLEHEDPERAAGSATNSPGESRRLLPAPGAHKSRLQSGLTLTVRNSPKKHSKCTLSARFGNPKAKTRSQKRKDKIIAALKPPYFILSMIIIMVCIHAWGSADLRAVLEWSPSGWWREPWRLLTYGWVHATNAHLALNALVALAVGWRLETEQSSWRVAVMWAGGVAAGALGAGALQPHVRVVGASAAVYALLCAHIPNVSLRFGYIPLWWFRPLSVVVLAASEGCWALLRSPPPALVDYTAGMPLTPSHNHIAWAAHVCGALVGIPLAFLVFTGENAAKRHVLVSRVASGGALLCSSFLAALYYTCWAEPSQPP